MYLNRNEGGGMKRGTLYITGVYNLIIRLDSPAELFHQTTPNVYDIIAIFMEGLRHCQPEKVVVLASNQRGLNLFGPSRSEGHQ